MAAPPDDAIAGRTYIFGCGLSEEEEEEEREEAVEVSVGFVVCVSARTQKVKEVFMRRVMRAKKQA